MINYKNRVYIFLSSLNLTNKKFGEVIGLFEDVTNIFSAFENNNKDLVLCFGKKYDEVKEKYLNFNFASVEKYLESKNAKVKTIEDVDYPECFFNLDQKPYIFYYIGDYNLISANNLAVVGTRTPSFYGKEVAVSFCSELCKHFCIVSGLAYGIDKIAGDIAIENNQKTIAVLGGGFDHIYPALHHELAKKIAENGLLITEYFITQKPTSFTFPARNRLIAALSKGVLIVEAGVKSGSMHTKNFALELGKDVFSVPCNINNIKGNGSNLIIKNGHAACVTEPNDILSYYGMDKIKQKTANLQLSFDEQNIYNMLKDREMAFEEIQIQTQMPPQSLNSLLTTLQIKGIIKKQAGNTFSI